MFRILLVCTGNTCRSPMAAALLGDMVAKAGLAGRIVVGSAGLAAGHQPASAHARSVMDKYGLSLDKHYAKQLAPEWLTAADLVLTMTVAHKYAVVGLAPAMADKIYTLAEFAGQAGGGVSDPFGGSEADYSACAGQLKKLLAAVWPTIVGLA